MSSVHNPAPAEPKNDLQALLARYRRAGFAVVRIPRRDGRPSKAPTLPGWNLERSDQNPHGYTDDMAAAEAWLRAGDNLGLAPLPSGVVVLDIDDLDESLRVFEGLEIPLKKWLADPDRVGIMSGKPGKAKLVFRLDGEAPAPSKRLNFGKGKSQRSILEIRRATADGKTVQDVAPPSVHPDTGKPYEWVGDCTRIPPLPPELVALWQSWPDALCSGTRPPPRRSKGSIWVS